MQTDVQYRNTHHYNRIRSNVGITINANNVCIGTAQTISTVFRQDTRIHGILVQEANQLRPQALPKVSVIPRQEQNDNSYNRTNIHRIDKMGVAKHVLGSKLKENYNHLGQLTGQSTCN